MSHVVHLRRPLTTGEVDALLPALLAVDSVRFADGARLLVESNPEALAILSAALGERDLLDRVEGGDDRKDVAPHTWAPAVVTLIVPAGQALPADVASQLEHWGLAALGVRRLSPAGAREQALEVYVDQAARADDCRAQLAVWAEALGIDVAVTPAASKRPRRRLVAFDMDSTLIRCEVIDELAKRAGVGEAVAEVTARAMRGELDFRASFRERMARLKGLDEASLEDVAAKLPLMGGVQELLAALRAEGHYTVILSGGFDYFARRLQQLMGFDEIHANVLHIEDGALTGSVEGEIVDGERKRALLGQIAAAQGLAMEDTVAVGDGANDLPMIGAAGLGVAFHAKPLVRERAPAALTHCAMTGLLYLLGYARQP